MDFPSVSQTLSPYQVFSAPRDKFIEECHGLRNILLTWSPLRDASYEPKWTKCAEARTPKGAK